VADRNLEVSDSFARMSEKLKLEIKGSMSLARNSNRYLSYLSDQILQSQDPEIRAFIDLITSRQKISVRGLIFIAMGEIAFSALLIFISLSFIIPAFFAYASPDVILHYFSIALGTVSSSRIITTAVTLIDFVICVVMLLSALQLLRAASETLRNAGIRVSEAN